MANSYFRFKQFTVQQDKCAMKVTTDGCLFGAWCAKEINTKNCNGALLDIGTGTGLLSLMIAQKNNVEIDAIEIEAAAAVQARENVEASFWKEKIHVYNVDISDFDLGNSYKIIVCNPPFYENEMESNNVDKNKAHHGHSLRLSELMQIIKKGLSTSGEFYLLLPYKRANEIKSLLKERDLYIEKKLVVTQSVLHAPFRLLVKGSLRPVETETSFLSIKDEKEQYTNEFIELLKDYYLNL